jgi:nucleoside-diphosphate-sugar epimerase
MGNTFEMLEKTNTPFIFASSQMSNMTHSTYGILKSVGEKYTNSLNGINVKFWNVYGYETNEEKSHVITDFIKMAKKDGCIKMRTTGDEVRQFLFGEDCAEGLYILAKNYNLNCPVKKIGTKKYDMYIPSTNKINKELNLVTKFNSLQAVYKTINLLKRNDQN